MRPDVAYVVGVDQSIHARSSLYPCGSQRANIQMLIGLDPLMTGDRHQVITIVGGNLVTWRCKNRRLLLDPVHKESIK